MASHQALHRQRCRDLVLDLFRYGDQRRCRERHELGVAAVVQVPRDSLACFQAGHVRSESADDAHALHAADAWQRAVSATVGAGSDIQMVDAREAHLDEHFIIRGHGFAALVRRSTSGPPKASMTIAVILKPPDQSLWAGLSRCHQPRDPRQERT
nr:hypothetical protein [Streptomyces sp. B93]